MESNDLLDHAGGRERLVPPLRLEVAFHVGRGLAARLQQASLSGSPGIQRCFDGPHQPTSTHSCGSLMPRGAQLVLSKGTGDGLSELSRDPRTKYRLYRLYGI